MWTNIKSLGLQRRKSFLFICAVCVIAIAIGVVNLFGHDDIYTYGIEQGNMNAGEYREDLDGVYLDESYGYVGDVVIYTGITLPEGVYRVQLQYETSVDYANLCVVSAPTVGYGGLLTNGANLHKGLDSTDYRMWVNRQVEGVNIHVTYNKGALLVKGLTILETNDLYKMQLFGIVLAAFAVILAYIYVVYDREIGINVDKKHVFFGWLLITLFASLPLMTDYILNGGDTGYHMMRIEGLKDGILSGQFPVRIAPRWLEDNGYASAIFYCETMLLPAALLRMLGFTITSSYRMFMLFINGLTAWIAYYSFSKMFKNRTVGLMCSMLHTLSIYRIYKTYLCGSLGETFGVLWLPLIVYGFYRVFTEDNKCKEYRWSFVPLSIGYAGLIQSHMLSCELAGGFTILLCVVMWRKVFQKETFFALAKGAVLAALISMWFVLPFLDYMTTGNFVIHNVSGRTIQERGLLLAHLFMVFPYAGGGLFFNETGMIDSSPMGIGFALLCVLIVWLYIRFVERKDFFDAREKVAGTIMATFAVIAMAMSLMAFPWDYLQSMNSLFATLISSIQFPNRFLTIATVLLVSLAGLVAGRLLIDENRWKGYGFIVMMCLLTLATSLFLLTDVMQKNGFSKIYNAEGQGFGYISGAEYLPYGANQFNFVFRNPSSSEEVIIDGYEKGSLSWDVNCYNAGSEEGHVVMPLLYYKGYQSWDVETGEKLRTYQGEEFSVWVEVPEGYSGVIHTEFVSPWYWRVAEVISVITVLSMVLLYRRDKKKLIMQKEA